MSEFGKSPIPSALAVVSVMVLAAGISTVSLVRAEAASIEPHSFIGTAPDAPAVELPQPPTF